MGWGVTHRSSKRVEGAALAAFTARLFVASGMDEADSATMARILVEQDRQGGRMSHGTACVGGRKYPRHIAAGLVNPCATAETPLLTYYLDLNRLPPQIISLP